MTDTVDVDLYEPMVQLADRIRSGNVSPVDVVEMYLEAIEERDPIINAYITVTADEARESARKAAKAVDSGASLGPLHGVPIALKDLRDHKRGIRHTFGSKPVADMEYISERTTASVQRLEEAGAIVIGKTNVSEFGHKGSTNNQVIGPTASPIDTDNNAGGSSGGSAAAVSAGMAAAATGSDSGGSIRIPAAACGVYGLKPSFGIIPIDSRPNAFGHPLNHTVLGPLTRTVEDAALLMDVLSGIHSSDPTTVPVDIEFTSAVNRDIEGIRIGFSHDLGLFDVDKSVLDVFHDGLEALHAAGAHVEPVSTEPDFTRDELTSAVRTTFATSILATVDAVEKQLGFDFRDRNDDVSDSFLDLLSFGDRKSARDVASTGIPRTKLYDALKSLFEEFDLIATPVLTSPGIDLHAEKTDWNRAMTWPFNVTGHPAASVPAGRTDNGHPVGLQLVGQRYRDDVVIAASAAVQREHPWNDWYPRDGLGS